MHRTCEDCNGDGGFESGPHGYDRMTGEPITHWLPCPGCGGAGWIEGEAEPLSIDDLPPPRDDVTSGRL
jgi:DnaJ-class molecular chaperone